MSDDKMKLISEAAQVALDACDRFMSGEQISDADKAIADRVFLASAFASEAYEQGGFREDATWAMQRSLLRALIDPLHSGLDYLRADPRSGGVARSALPSATEAP